MHCLTAFLYQNYVKLVTFQSYDVSDITIEQKQMACLWFHFCFYWYPIHYWYPCTHARQFWDWQKVREHTLRLILDAVFFLQWPSFIFFRYVITISVTTGITIIDIFLCLLKMEKENHRRIYMTWLAIR